MITIGHIAKTYGLLPSEVVERGTAFDIMVADVYTTWEAHQRDPNSVSNYDTEDLQKMVEKTKNGG